MPDEPLPANIHPADTNGNLDNPPLADDASGGSNSGVSSGLDNSFTPRAGGWSRGEAVRGEYRGKTEILTPESEIDFGPETEYRLWRKVNELSSIMGDNPGVGLTGLYIKDKNADWRTQAISASWQEFGGILDQLDIISQQLAEKAVEIAAATVGPTKTKLENERDVFIKERDKLIKVKDERSQTLSGQHIFGGIVEAMQANYFVAQQELAISAQVGLALSKDQDRNLAFVLPTPQDIDIILQQAIPAADRGKLIYLKEKLGIKGLSDKLKAKHLYLILSELAVGGAADLAVTQLLNNPSLGKAAGIGGVALAGLHSAALIFRSVGKAVERGHAEWQLAQPEGKPEEKLTFKLTLTDTGRRLTRDPNNPISRHFSGVEGTRNAVRFLTESETVRAEIAHSLRVEPWQIDLAAPKMAIAEGRGQDTILNGLAQDYKVIILERQFKHADGSVMRFDELTLEQQSDVWSRAIDMAMQQFGGDDIRRKLEEVAKREARGERPERFEGRNGELMERAQQLRSGQFTEETASSQTAAELSKEKQKKQNSMERMAAAKERLITLAVEITTKENERASAQENLASAKDVRGRPTVIKIDPTDSDKIIVVSKGTGEIGQLEEQKKRAEAQYQTAFEANGSYVLNASGVYVSQGLTNNIVQADYQLSRATDRRMQAERTLKERTEKLKRLKQEFARNETATKKLSPDTVTQKKNEIEQLEKDDITAEGSIAQSDEEFKKTTEEEAGKKALSKNLHDIYDKNDRLIQKLDGEATQVGSLAWFDAQIIAAVEDVANKEKVVKQKKRELQRLLKDRNQLLTDAFGKGIAGQNPSVAAIADIISSANSDLTKTEEEIANLQTLEAAGGRKPTEEELERADAIELAAGLETPEKINELEMILLRGGLTKELVVTHGDKGIRLLYEAMFGSTAVLEGKGGKYRLARRLLSKGMIVDKAIVSSGLWGIAENLDAFFGGRSDLKAEYHKAQTNIALIETYRREIAELRIRGENDKANGRLVDIRRLQQENDLKLGLVYDELVTPLLCLDEVKTAGLMISLADDIYERCKQYNPFGEIIGHPQQFQDREIRSTANGEVTVYYPERNDNGSLKKRSTVIVENPGGNNGIRYEVGIDNTAPEGKLQLTAAVPKSDQILDKLPDTVVSTMPEELKFFFYDPLTLNKRADISRINAFIDGLTDVAAVQALTGNKAIIRMLFKVTSEGPPITYGDKIASSEIAQFVIRRDAVTISDLTALESEIDAILTGTQADFMHSLGNALIYNSSEENRQLYQEHFRRVGIVPSPQTFAGCDYFVIQNESGRLIAYYQNPSNNQDESLELYQIIEQRRIPSLNYNLSQDEINALLQRAAAEGFTAMRKVS